MVISSLAKIFRFLKLNMVVLGFFNVRMDINLQETTLPYVDMEIGQIKHQNVRKYIVNFLEQLKEER